ncbi:MAG: hypothetical protein JXA99_05815 [Candidatus Lokiarchaeota archaeon]|nr:hypothetical protein [Candidatus Lokiarchaeota archaeon]
MSQKRLSYEFLNEFEDYDFSKIKEEKIFLIGSISKAKDFFIKIESILQIKYKKIVSICSVDGLLNKDKFSYIEWAILQEIALKKLIDQEAILVLDIDNYIGEQTEEEIDYFKNKLKRKVYYLSKL